MRSALFLLSLVAVLGLLNNEVRKKEQVVREGRVVLLELGPRDPRSIMQGDYMVLRYAIAPIADSHEPHGGAMVLVLDENNVAEFRRMHDGGPLSTDEVLLEYRARNGRVWLGAESFFFQEGSAHMYNNARYGELRVDGEGNSVLIGLRDAQREMLGEPVVSAVGKGLLFPN